MSLVLTITDGYRTLKVNEQAGASPPFLYNPPHLTPPTETTTQCDLTHRLLAIRYNENPTKNIRADAGIQRRAIHPRHD